MTEVRVRMPTHTEAVEFLLRFRLPVYKDYRRNYLTWLGERAGGDFAARVEAEVRARW
jgi:hypothetical protein